MRYEPIMDKWLDQLLMDIAHKVQLSAGAYDRAVDRYNRIAAYIGSANSSLSALNPLIYPQGSFRVGSVISAHDDTEDYDIDLLLELDIPADSDPAAVLDLVQADLNSAKGVFQFSECRPKRRCVTIEYSDMHLDITPAVRVGGTTPRIVSIFDTHPERANHSIANPEGFARWFEAAVMPAEFLQERLLKADAIPVPAQKPIEQKPERLLTVQLLKRFRDVMVDAKGYERCPSVLLSKIAAEAPKGEGLFRDLVSASSHIANAITDIPPPVTNPSCQQDDFSDRWPAGTGAEWSFRSDLLELVGKLQSLAGPGPLTQKQRTLELLFGERATRSAFDELSKRAGAQSAQGGLFTAGPVGAMVIENKGLAANPVPRHRFYGET